MNLGFATTLAFLATLVVPTITTAQSTIGELQQTNSVTLSGEVLRVQGDDFILSDGTGQIWVEAERRPIREAGLKAGDRVTVAGVYDDENSFEALSITPSNGTVIYVFDD
ncbi:MULTISPECIES: NirD/YgiW/YdeI family stress tolerance protein [unclassified Leptolyngbya]|uniref:NirD/YgiW/YdeI family stress tolerance protein n=1 Tax=unclassified Leptolyngbya TaxID=2650499 RepID=UPI0016851961|nr:MULTISPECIES: NirD/YgiW/YdeI family stress tolerance protein [unclassified Leptolyngbya]MBD1911345.1 NirD/YgiW/YdeI family stress tolerance protein [Leptolyngbya sp. FACHB-8]MBD2156637.1 NirD/YgiW/YdeI family stress tolerance protein [Leptolyngbya sp. FACHB-16]